MQASRLDRILRVVSIVLLIGLTGIIIGAAFPRLRTTLASPETKVLVEMADIEACVNAFQFRVDAYPPSRIILHEQPGRHPYDLRGTNVHARIEQRTLAYLQRTWPRFDAVTCEIDTDGDGKVDCDWVDYNANGKIDDELELDGAECLVFFLAGQFRGNDPIGFSNNPQNPFGSDPQRVGPYAAFDARRFIDRDADGFREYVDPIPGQTVPYQYFSSYGGGAGYNFRFDVATADNGPFQAYFKEGDPQTSQAGVKWHNPSSFQIISPGHDGKLGSGGLFDPLAPDKLSPDDADNLANFRTGRLRPL